MKGSSYFKPMEGKCPNCGAFGNNTEEVDIGDGKICPMCKTVFNKYMVLDEGKELKFRNN